MTNTRTQSKAFRSQVAQIYVSLFFGHQRFSNAMLYSIEAPKNKPKQQSNLRLLKSRNQREGKRRKVFIKRSFKIIGSDISWFEYVPALSRRKVKS